MAAQHFSCLSIETATDRPSVALLHAGTLRVREEPGLKAPSRAVFSWAHALLADAGIGLAELHCIAFGAGPGSFTGVRVAVSFAQSLGYAADRPLCPVSTLAALASAGFRDSTSAAIACCLDARMGELYFGVYAKDPARVVRPLLADTLLAPERITADGLSASALGLPSGAAIRGVGSGWDPKLPLVERLTTSLVGIDAELRPSASDIIALARPQFFAGEFVTAMNAEPNYLRERVADPARKHAKEVVG